MRLQQFLREENLPEKGGMVPFHLVGDDIKVMLMRPSDPNYGGSNYQIAKGSRDVDEDIKMASLREGKEELGLREDNIKFLMYVGSEVIKEYRLYVYASEVVDSNEFDEPHYETGSVKWFGKSELGVVREEHQSLVEMVFSTVRKGVE